MQNFGNMYQDECKLIMKNMELNTNNTDNFPVRYIVYTNCISLDTSVSLALYPDDTMFSCYKARPSLPGIRRLQQIHMDLFFSRLKKWRIAVNSNKSLTICFRSRCNPNNMVEPTELDGEEILVQWNTMSIASLCLLILSFVSMTI